MLDDPPSPRRHRQKPQGWIPSTLFLLRVGKHMTTWSASWKQPLLGLVSALLLFNWYPSPFMEWREDMHLGNSNTKEWKGGMSESFLFCIQGILKGHREALDSVCWFWLNAHLASMWVIFSYCWDPITKWPQRDHLLWQVLEYRSWEMMFCFLSSIWTCPLRSVFL